MEKPLSAGDICIVIDGLGKKKSPNIGKLVTIDKRVYGDQGRDHRLFGPIYKCIGLDLVQMNDSGEYFNTASADFAGIWLQRIDPSQLKKELIKAVDLTNS